MMQCERVSLGELLRLERRPVEVMPDEQYAEIGLYCFGRGIFHKTPRSGAEVGGKDLYLIKEGDFILQITFAWEGAVALASKNEDGMFGSVRFPTFRIDESRCHPPYLLNYFKTKDGVEQLGKISPGSADRNRVLSLKRIPEVIVPLPSLEEQRRIVARIEQIAANIEEARGLRREAIQELSAFCERAFLAAFPPAGEQQVQDYVSLQSGYAFKSHWFTETGIRLVRNVNVGHGTIDWRETARIPESRRDEFHRFELNTGDILVYLDRPIISTGVKVARVYERDLPSLLLQRVARVNFKNSQVDPSYFFYWLRSPVFIQSIDPGRSNGVPHISPKEVEKIKFSAPPLDEQRRIVAYLDNLQTKVDAVKKLQAETAAEIDALLPSILDRAFKGEL